MTTRKPRPQGPLAHLTPKQVAKLHGFFEANLPYSVILRRIRNEDGISTSLTALGNAYRTWGRSRLFRQAAEASTVKASGIEILVESIAPGTVRLIVRPVHEPPETPVATGDNAV